MARPKNPISTDLIVEDKPLPPEMALSPQVHSEMAMRIARVVEQYGDGLPFDELRYEDKIRGHLNRSADEMLAAGRALIVVKECLPHGQWVLFLEKVGIDRRVAWSMQQAAIKYSNVQLTGHLVKAASNKTKLFELMLLDDEELQELNDGGTVVGLTLDDVERMTVRELRAALRDAREDKKATQEILDNKNKQIDRLTSELHKTRERIENYTPDEHRAVLRSEVAIKANAAEFAVVHFENAIASLYEYEKELDSDSAAVLAGYYTMVKQRLEDMQTRFQIRRVAEYRPDWLNIDADGNIIDEPDDELDVQFVGAGA